MFFVLCEQVSYRIYLCCNSFTLIYGNINDAVPISFIQLDVMYSLKELEN